MRGTLSRIGLLCMLLACAGCGLATPNVVHPGSESYQQARARIFEPYPENEPGPAVGGARPREYQNPLAEPDRVMPRPGEAIVWPYRGAVTQPPPAQPTIVTPPPAIPCPVQPVSP